MTGKKTSVLMFLFLLASLVYGQGKNVLSADGPDKVITGKPVVAYIDMDYVFKNHPWTSLTKTELQNRLKSKALEIDGLKKDIENLKNENIELSEGLDVIRPFYQKRYVSQMSEIKPVGPDWAEQEKIYQIADELAFSGADIRFNSPLDSNKYIEETEAKIEDNTRQIMEKSLKIDIERFETRNKVKQEEQVEVQEILEDIYAELKLFCMKRNVAIVVNKKDILYGQKPVDITTEFAQRIQKTRKDGKSKKKNKSPVILELDSKKAPEINIKKEE
ncbi:hypothetical protein Emin_0074 [Elusimicrobium minutum Pei191]|uniref:Outer membrane chaperone Skp (OmpH) n=1 Tax=Elusimicrobium minutum (strain Pei191) TaxID=445932 RepID=B2KAU5_ELUMP|nr:hypothetical protein [Elusimicrobium minutum]ACC97641.1 hypothetical protein Emin_0074 [Elusimicrobium minutum Pei191]